MGCFSRETAFSLTVQSWKTMSIEWKVHHVGDSLWTHLDNRPDRQADVYVFHYRAVLTMNLLSMNGVCHLLSWKAWRECSVENVEWHLCLFCFCLLSRHFLLPFDFIWCPSSHSTMRRSFYLSCCYLLSIFMSFVLRVCVWQTHCLLLILFSLIESTKSFRDRLRE